MSKPIHTPKVISQRSIDQRGTSKVRTKAKHRLSLVESEPEMLARIDALAANDNNRPLQTRAYEDFARSIRDGRRSGIFKLPTGTGKTRVFSNILHSLGRNGLILIPRTPLYKSTRRELAEAGFSEDEIKCPHEEDGTNAEDRFMSMLTDPSIDWKSGRIQCIMTYQSLVSMVRKNPLMAEFVRSHFGVIIEDEAHRGLGEQTRAATGAIDRADEIYAEEEIDADELAELKAELKAEQILSTRSDLFHYYFTATPDLIDKSIAESEEYITFATVEEAIRTGAIVLPQFVDVGEAYIRETPEEDTAVDKWKSGDIDRYSEDDAFVDEHGISIREKIITAYQEKLSLHGKLPAVAFASTTDHAEQIVADMRKAGIRATRVTSAPWDLSPDEGTALMDDDRLDVIVTVMKVAEGFDYPPLSCAMWFAPSLSSAKIMQGNGRIMRVTDDKLPQETVGPDGRLIPSPNTYIIGPSAWHAGSPGGGRADNEDGDGKKNKGFSDSATRTIGRIGNFYELLIGRGEIDFDALPDGVRDIVDNTQSLRCEPGELRVIDGIEYIGVTQTSIIWEIKWFTILNNLKRAGDIVRSFSGNQKGGYSITLVPKFFIESLRDTCETGEVKIIDGVEYIGVTGTKVVLWIRWDRILRNLKRAGDTIKSLPGKQKNGKSITLVRKDFIESLAPPHICEPGELKVIDGIEYIGVTQTSMIWKIKWFTILNSLKRAENSIESLPGKQKNGKSITLVRKDFIELLAPPHICEPGELKVIDGIEYVGVTSKNGALGIGWGAILRNLKWAEDTIKSLPGKQKNGQAITLVRKDFIEELCNTCEPGELKILNGVEYYGVTRASEILGIKWQTIHYNLKQVGEAVKSLQWRQKGGHSITLVPKSFIEELARKAK